MKLQQVKPKIWEVKPTFDFGLKYEIPYIWFGWWLITWYEEWFKIGKISIPKIEIDYLPD